MQRMAIIVAAFVLIVSIGIGALVGRMAGGGKESISAPVSDGNVLATVATGSALVAGSVHATRTPRESATAIGSAETISPGTTSPAVAAPAPTSARMPALRPIVPSAAIAVSATRPLVPVDPLTPTRTATNAFVTPFGGAMATSTVVPAHTPGEAIRPAPTNIRLPWPPASASKLRDSPAIAPPVSMGTLPADCGLVP
jgi:hypothetical protein